MNTSCDICTGYHDLERMVEVPKLIIFCVLGLHCNKKSSRCYPFEESEQVQICNFWKSSHFHFHFEYDLEVLAQY